jgi:hypothetical protein
MPFSSTMRSGVLNPARTAPACWAKAVGEPYRHTALGVIRVRDGEIVRYDDYMNPIAVARLLGRTAELAAALSHA